jgi:hypothetical protein
LSTSVGTHPAPKIRWRWFVLWAFVGGAAAFGAISFLVVGLVGLAVAVLVAVLMASRPGVRGSAFGLLSGAGLLLLYVAYVQRQGPGTTCWHTATSNGCETHLDPVPWLVVGLVFVITGLLLHASRTRWTRPR